MTHPPPTARLTTPAPAAGYAAVLAAVHASALTAWLTATAEHASAVTARLISAASAARAAVLALPFAVLSSISVAIGVGVRLDLWRCLSGRVEGICPVGLDRSCAA